MKCYWEDVYKWLKKILAYELPKTVAVIFGLFESMETFQRNLDIYTVYIFWLQLRKLSHRNGISWTPTLNNWMDIEEDIHNMERFIHSETTKIQS